MKKRSYLSTDLVNYLKKMATEYSNPKYVIKYSCLKSRSLKTALVRDFSNIQYRASPNPTESERVCLEGVSSDHVYSLTRLNDLTQTPVQKRNPESFESRITAVILSCIMLASLYASPWTDRPDPTLYGWCMTEGILQGQWMAEDHSPRNLTALIYCSRKKGCASRLCSCRASKFACNGLCKCTGCSNKEEAEDDLPV